jgi:hypothetical protein
MTRRQDSRLEVVNAEGLLQVLRDVIVRRTADGAFVAIGNEAGIRGELLTIYIAADGNQPVQVRVTDSYPTLIGGCVRHEIRLMPLDHSEPGDVIAERDDSSEGA